MADKLNVPTRFSSCRAAAAIALSLACAAASDGSSASPGATQCRGGIFTDTPRQGSIDPGSTRAVKRLRRVEVDFGRIFPNGAAPMAAHIPPSLVLNLFPDVCLVASREQATDLGPLKIRWVGTIDKAAEGKAILVIDDELMVGTVTADRRTFQIRYLGDGVHAVADVDSASFPRD